jgi:hypothetical protein
MHEHDQPASTRPMPALTLPQPRRSAWGLAASLALHAAVLLLIVGGVLGGAERLRVAGGSGPGAAGGGGGGGGRVSYIELPPVGAQAPAAAPVAETPPVVTPPVEEAPVATPVPPPEPTDIAAAAAPRADTAATSGTGSGTGSGTDSGSGGGSGGGTGGGTGPGEGLGVGPGTGGDSTDIAPPQLRNWVPPMERPPKELRGRTIRVTFWVSADGRVDKFETDPRIEDRDYFEKFSEIVMKTRFRPARTRAGVPVAVVFPMDFILATGS